jgi:hypothetical protein
MARDPSKLSKPESKPPKLSKPESKPPKTSKAPSKPPWGWGPDGKYTPLTDDGVLPEHLPDHIELARIAREEEMSASEWRCRHDEQRARAERLAAKLRELGIDPSEV